MKKSLRFRIFKRDGFRCQYCGRTSAEIRLHVDHVVPQCDGGTDDETNLLTACEDCNLGKGRKRISEEAQAGVMDIDLLAKEQELKELEFYGRLVRATQEAEDRAVWQLAAYWHKLFGPYCCETEMDDNGALHAKNYLMNTLRRWVQLEIDPKVIMEAMSIASSREWNSSYKSWKYTCGIVWKSKERTVKGAL